MLIALSENSGSLLTISRKQSMFTDLWNNHTLCSNNTEEFKKNLL